MSSPPLLLTYYNNISLNSLNYFSILNGNIIVSKYDMMNNICSLFMNNTNNNLVYIFNGPNIGCFSINSLLYTDQYSNTYSINLYSIPVNLSDNILCVLSNTIPTYNISRTFLTTMNSNINNFTTLDSKTFVINTQSYSDVSTSYDKLSNNKIEKEVDDTLFLYIIATNKSFNIIFNSSTIHTISNVTIQPSRSSNLTSLVFLGNSLPINFTENTKYTIYISTENSSTVSNIVFNNTPIKPLNYSDIDLTNTPNSSILNGSFIDKSFRPSNTIEITPIKVKQQLVPNIVSLNNLVSTHVPLNQCVILNIINSSYHNLSGYFSISSSNTPNSKLVKGLTIDVQENYSNKPANNVLSSGINNFFSDISNSTKSVTLNTYKAFIDNTNVDHKTVINSVNSVSNIGKNAYDSISYAYKVAKVNNQGPTKPDNIDNIPIIAGTGAILNISYVDINNNKINFITPNIMIYLSNKLNTLIYSINSAINNVINPDASTILSFNGEFNSTSLPDHTDNIPYVLSSGPIAPYLTYSYDSAINTNSVVKNGTFSFGTTSNTIIINNIDFNSIDAIPFISLLYTIVNTDITLNILNLDYSFACSLIITSVALSQVQSIISFSIKSGNLPTSSLNTYILTLLHTTDIISSINNNKKYNDVLNKNNKLILMIQTAINNSNLNIPNNSNIQHAQFIITNAANQSTILLNIPFINTNSTTLQITNATITMSFNAINYALLGDPNNIELQNLYSILTQLSNPVIAVAILNNALSHVTILINKNLTSENLPVFTKAKNAINDAIIKISAPDALDSPTLNTTNSTYIPIINSVLEQVNNALIVIPDDIHLLKAQAILLTINPPKNKPYKIESMESKNSSSNYTPSTFQIICGFLVCIVFISCIAYLINEQLSKEDKKFFSSENSSSNSS